MNQSTLLVYQASLASGMVVVAYYMIPRCWNACKSAIRCITVRSCTDGHGGVKHELLSNCFVQACVCAPLSSNYAAGV